MECFRIRTVGCPSCLTWHVRTKLNGLSCSGYGFSALKLANERIVAGLLKLTRPVAGKSSNPRL
jgi:hypothetical protein